MRTNQILAASCVAAALLVVGTACSSNDGASTPTTVASKSSGGGDVSTTAGGGSTDGVDLPDQWPEELAMPDGVVALEATNVGDGGSAVVVARVDGDAKSTVEAFETQLTDADWTIVSSDFTDSPQGGFGGVSATGRKYTVAIALGPDPTGDTTEVTINLAEKTST